MVLLPCLCLKPPFFSLSISFSQCQEAACFLIFLQLSFLLLSVNPSLSGYGLSPYVWREHGRKEKEVKRNKGDEEAVHEKKAWEKCGSLGWQLRWDLVFQVSMVVSRTSLPASLWVCFSANLYVWVNRDASSKGDPQWGVVHCPSSLKRCPHPPPPQPLFASFPWSLSFFISVLQLSFASPSSSPSDSFFFILFLIFFWFQVQNFSLRFLIMSPICPSLFFPSFFSSVSWIFSNLCCLSHSLFPSHSANWCSSTNQSFALES